MSGFDGTALTVKVDSLEGQFKDLKTSVSDLDTKLDKSMASLASEVRNAIAALSNQIAERQKTPWVVIFSGAGVLITLIGVFTAQALTPIQYDVRQLQSRYEASQRQRYDEQRAEIAELRERLRQAGK